MKPGTPLGTAVLWARKNLFSSWFNSLLTLFCLWLMWLVIPPLLNWVIFQANWVGTARTDCTKAGACWVFIHARFGQFMYGLYPFDQRWRINVTLIVGLLTLAPIFFKATPRRGRYIACWMATFFRSASKSRQSTSSVTDSLTARVAGCRSRLSRMSGGSFASSVHVVTP